MIVICGGRRSFRHPESLGRILDAMCWQTPNIPIVLAEYEEVGQGDGGKDLAATGGLRAGSIPASRRPARRGGAIIRAPQVPEVGEGQNGRKDKRAATGR